MTELQTLRLSNAQWRLKCASREHYENSNHATEMELFKAAVALAKEAIAIDPRLYADDHCNGDVGTVQSQ